MKPGGRIVPMPGGGAPKPPITHMTAEEAFAWIRERAPSAGEITFVPGVDGSRTIYLERATAKDANRLRTSLGLWSPIIGPGWRVERTGLPHLYFWQGRWWVTKNGRREWRHGLTLNDSERPTFAEACQLAQLAAIYSGVWQR